MKTEDIFGFFVMGFGVGLFVYWCVLVYLLRRYHDQSLNGRRNRKSLWQCFRSKT
jgi:hypothetical protein